MTISIANLQLIASDGPYHPDETDAHPCTRLNLGTASTPTRTPVVNYKIFGNDRDWVFLTSSQLDERLAKIRRTSPLPAFMEGGSFPAIVVAIPFALIVALSVLSFGGSDSTLGSTTYSTQLAALDQAEQAWRSGSLHDPIEALFLVYRLEAKATTERRVLLSISPAILITLSLFTVGIVAYAVFFTYFYPVTNFLWGDYVPEFERRQNLGRYIFSGLILATVTSALGSALFAFLGWVKVVSSISVQRSFHLHCRDATPQVR